MQYPLQKDPLDLALFECNGNMTLWLNNFELYDRKATESSNLVLLPPSHGAPYPLPSAEMVEIHGEVSLIDPGDIHISCALGELSKMVSHSISLDFETEAGHFSRSFVLGPFPISQRRELISGSGAPCEDG